MKDVAEQMSKMFVEFELISESEREGFHKFYQEPRRIRFVFSSGRLKDGWYHRGQTVGCKPECRKKNQQLLRDVNTELDHITRRTIASRHLSETPAGL